MYRLKYFLKGLAVGYGVVALLSAGAWVTNINSPNEKIIIRLAPYPLSLDVKLVDRG